MPSRQQIQLVNSILTKEYLEESYVNRRLSLANIAKECGLSVNSVYTRCKKFGINIRSYSDSHRIPGTIDNYFSSMNHKSAYILGFITADGCVSSKTKNRPPDTLSFSLGAKDIEILEFIKSEISPNSKIRKFKVKKKSGKIRDMVSLNITSTEICNDLKIYNVIPRKTGKESLPTNLDPELFCDYLRGVFDGDGCFHRPKRFPNSGIFNIVSSNKVFLDDLQTKVCQKFGTVKQTKSKKRKYNLYEFRIQKPNQLIFIYNSIYNGEFKLTRKFKIFSDWKNKYEVSSSTISPC